MKVVKDLLPKNWIGKPIQHLRRDEVFLQNRLDRNLENIFQEIKRDLYHFENFLPNLLRSSFNKNFSILPKTDFFETEKEYFIEIDLPGVNDQDLDISLSKDSVLTIQGKRENEEEQKNRNYYTLERSYGSFERSIILPTNSDLDQIAASFIDGILKIKIPKKEQYSSELRKITITN